MNVLRSLIEGWREYWSLSWWAKGPALATMIVLLIFVIGLAAAAGDTEPTEDEIGAAVAQAVERTPTPEPTVLRTVLPMPSPLVRTTVVTREVIPSPTVIIPSPTVIVQEPEPPPGPATSFGDGIHVVGVDIQPGTYSSSPADSCYWARLSGFSGELEDIIANDNSVRPIVTILASDTGFESSRCGAWTRVD